MSQSFTGTAFTSRLFHYSSPLKYSVPIGTIKPIWQFVGASHTASVLCQRHAKIRGNLFKV